MKAMIGAGALALAVLGGAPLASATPLLFSVTDSDAPGLTATFQLDSNPVLQPYQVDSNDDIFYIYDVPVTVDNTVVAVDLGFAGETSPLGPAVGLTPESDPQDTIVGTGSVPLFTGPAATPEFSPGVYDFTDTVDCSTLVFTVTDVSCAPEPSTWALMISGVALIGAALRFGRRRGSVAFA